MSRENRKICVIMSAYNGSKYIEKQLDSIFAQKGVDVIVYVRNDGSKDNTIDVLREYQKTHEKLIIEDAENVGWERSFLLALKIAPQADYYAFSDQDDIWFDNKLEAGVMQLEKCDPLVPTMIHCNKLSVWEDLTPLRTQLSRIPQPINRKNALIQEWVQGCSSMLNNAARELICSYMPKEKLAHDYWCGMLCYLFGKVLYDDNKYFYHISHGTNASGEGHKWASWRGRLKTFFTAKETYYRPYNDLLEGYGGMLTASDKAFIHDVLNYKRNFKSKIKILLSTDFVRCSLLGTLSLKFAILFNKL